MVPRRLLSRRAAYRMLCAGGGEQHAGARLPTLRHVSENTRRMRAQGTYVAALAHGRRGGEALHRCRRDDQRERARRHG